MKFIRSKCYHEPQLALKIEGVKYFAADAMGISDFRGDLVFNLSGEPKMAALDLMPSELAQHVMVPYKEIMVPWPDGGVPLVKASFWQALHTYVRDNGYREICLHCEAGHGRTGTALSSLAITNLGWSVEKAMKHIRLKICRHMVETSDQCEYLLGLDYEMNGREATNEDLPDPSMNIMIEEYYAEKQREEQEQEEDPRRKEE